MRLLAVETSTDACSVAVRVGADTVERFEVAPRRHGDLLLGFVDELMSDAGLKPEDLDGIALGRGPGSFTGLRLGAGVVQGIAFAAELQVACVSSLAALARSVDAPRVFCAQDARMGEVYVGGFQHQGDGVAVVVPERVSAPQLLDALPGGRWLGVGSGFTSYAAELGASLGAGLERQDPEHRYPRARDVLRLGEAMLEAGEGVEASRALPVYLRDQVTRPPAAS